MVYSATEDSEALLTRVSAVTSKLA